MFSVLLMQICSLRVSTGELMAKGLAFSQKAFIYFPKGLEDCKARQVGDNATETVDLQGPIDHILLGNNGLKIDSTKSPAEYVYLLLFQNLDDQQTVYLLHGNSDEYFLAPTDTPTDYYFINLDESDLTLYFDEYVSLSVYDSKGVEYLNTPICDTITLKPLDNCMFSSKNKPESLTKFSVQGSSKNKEVEFFNFSFSSVPMFFLQNGTSYTVTLIPKPQEPNGNPLTNINYTISNNSYNLPITYDPVTIKLKYLNPNDILIFLNSQYSTIQADFYANKTLVYSKEYSYDKNNILGFLDSGKYIMEVTINTKGRFAAIAQSMKANKRMIGSPKFCNLSIDNLNTHIIVWAIEPYTISQSGVSFTEIAINEEDQGVGNTTITNAIVTSKEKSSGIIILTNNAASNRSFTYKTSEEPVEWNWNSATPNQIFQPQPKDKLTAGEIAGISVGCILAVICIAVGIFFIVRRPARVEGPVWQ